jgi:excisionase family DNA binding protein
MTPGPRFLLAFYSFVFEKKTLDLSAGSLQEQPGMAKDRVISKRPESPQQPPMEDASSSIKVCADALLDAFRCELEMILSRARGYERSIKESLESVTLLTREEAAQRLRMSSSQLDLLVKQGAIAATKFDRRPRFKLQEIARFLEAHTPRSRRARSQ